MILNNNILNLDISITKKMVLAMYSYPIDEIESTLQISKRSIQRYKKELKIEYPDLIQNDKFVAPTQNDKSVAIDLLSIDTIENDKSVAIDLELKEMIENIIPPDWKSIGWNDDQGFHYKNINTVPD